MMPSLDEMIKHYEKVAEDQEWMANHYDDDSMGKEMCLECAKDHRQLAEWLRELKAYKEERVSCEYCKYNGRQQHERPCSLCKRNFVDMFEREVNADE